jgi:hypothetical protein
MLIEVYEHSAKYLSLNQLSFEHDVCICVLPTPTCLGIKGLVVVVCICVLDLCIKHELCADVFKSSD